jgi:hypothetical protein
MQAASSLLRLHEVRSRYPPASSLLTILNGGSAILVEGGLTLGLTLYLGNGNLQSCLFCIREIMHPSQRTYPCGSFALP